MKLRRAVSPATQAAVGAAACGPEDVHCLQESNCRWGRMEDGNKN